METSDVWSAIVRSATANNDALAYHPPGFEANCTTTQIATNERPRARKGKQTKCGKSRPMIYSCRTARFQKWTNFVESSVSAILNRKVPLSASR